MSRRGRLAAVLLCLVGLLSLGSPLLVMWQPCSWLDAKSSDWLLALKGRREPCGAFMVVGLDADTHERLPLASYYWGWYYAKVLSLLSKNGAKAIALDLILEESNPQPVLGSAQEQELKDLEAEGYAAMGRAIAEARFQDNCPVFLACRIVDGELRLPRTDLLESAGGADALGFINLMPDRATDQVVRQFPLSLPCQRSPRKLLPSLPYLAAMYASTGSMKAVQSLDCSPSIYINFIGPAGSYPHLSFLDLLYQSIGKTERRGNPWNSKVVFIGAWERPGDLYRTPFSNNSTEPRMSGVEILANAADTVYAGTALKPMPAWALIAAVFLLLTVSCCGVLWLVAGPSLVLDSVLVGAVALAALWGDSTRLQTFPGTVLLLLAAQSAVSRLAKQRFVEAERNRIAAHFRLYVGDRPLKQLLSRSAGLAAGEKHAVALLFADLRGFTSHASQAPAEDVVRMLTQYHDKLSSIAAAHGGWVVKLMGDGSLMVFGYVQPTANAAQDAVEAASAIVATARPVVGQGGEHLQIGVTLHYGEVIIGNIGTKGKLDFTAIGDAVNTVAHLQEACRQLGEEVIATSELVSRLPVESAASFNALGPIAVHGKGVIELYSRCKSR